MTKMKLFKTIACMTLALTLCLGMALPVFADSLDKVSIGSPDKDAEAALTKILKVPFGTPIPDSIKFEFAITKVSLDGNTADLDKMPAIGTKNVAFVATDTYKTENGDTDVYTKESESLFVGAKWPQAGVYRYHVVENQSHTQAPGFDIYHEKIFYSQEKYDIEVYVDTHTDGTLYIRYIVAYLIITNEDGEEKEYKVDPTPGGGVEDKYSDMTFLNKYFKYQGGPVEPDPDDPEVPTNPGNGAFYLKKTVAGLSSNQTDLYFPFTITLTRPSIATQDTVYRAYLMRGANHTPQTILSANFDTTLVKKDANGRQYIEFTINQGNNSSSLTINLRHDEWLSFPDMPVGARVMVKENAVVDYTPSYQLTVNGKGPAIVDSKTPNTDLAFPDPVYLGTETNKADFTNTYKDVTPTGIAVDDLPYIAIGVLAVLALVGYVVIKSRGHREAKKA